MEGNNTRDKLLGNNEYISYENLSSNHNVIVIGNDASGKTSNWVIPNAKWINSRVTIVTDRDMSVSRSVADWEEQIGESSPLEKFVFDAERKDGYKYNPFASDFGDPVKKIRHLARSFLSASKGVPQTEEFYSLYIALVCSVYFGVTTKTNNLQGLKDTFGMEFNDFKTKMTLFVQDAEKTFDNKPSFIEYLNKFINIPNSKSSMMFDYARTGMAPFLNDSALEMSDTQKNAVMRLDIQAYRMYVNLKPDKFDTTNCMFALFLDNILDRHIYFSKNLEEDITPYKHFVLDHIELLPLSPHVRKNLVNVSKMGITTTVVAEHAVDVKSYFETFGTTVLMGGTDSPEDIRFLSETYSVSIDDIMDSNKPDNVLIFRKGAPMSVDRKLGERGVFS